MRAVCLLFLLAACTVRPGRPDSALLTKSTDGEQQLKTIEYRWGDNPDWGVVETLRTQPPGRGNARVLHARVTVPPNTCADPVVYVSACVYLKKAVIGGRQVDRVDCFIPVRADEAGKVVDLTFESTQHMREGSILFACQNALRHRVADAEEGALWVSFALIIAGAFLGLLTLRGGTEVGAMGSAALFATSVGILMLQQTTTSTLLVPLGQAVFRAMRDVSVFVFPGAFALFVGTTVAPLRRQMFLCAAAQFAVLAVFIVLDLVGLVSLRLGAAFSVPIGSVAFCVVVVGLFRHRKTDLAAPRLLVGLVVTFVLLIPDSLWGMGIQAINTSIAHLAFLPVMGSMALVVQDRFRATALATAQRLKHIELLNEELRFQVESRSRELVSVVGSRPSPRAAEEYASGVVIADRYRIESPLGRGGMAHVYRVTRLSDGQQLALKVLAGEVTRVDASRFAREGEVASRLRHKNLVPVVDVGMVPDGPIYLVLELIEGGSLEDHRDRFGQLPWARAVLADIARGLAAVHAAGIVHRDLKPSNVLMAGNTGRLADFGVARPIHAVEPESDDDATADRSPRLKLTQTGAMVGTPRYMSPEVVHGQVATYASDAYALGLLAFELLTGKYPLAEPPFVALIAHRSLQRIVPDTDLPAGIRTLLGQLLEEEPSRRPTAADVLKALET